MLKSAKSIEKEGLVWGASKLVPVGYGINKLQLMSCANKFLNSKTLCSQWMLLLCPKSKDENALMISIINYPQMKTQHLFIYRTKIPNQITMKFPYQFSL